MIKKIFALIVTMFLSSPIFGITPYVEDELILMFDDTISYSEIMNIVTLNGDTIVKKFKSSNSVLVKLNTNSFIQSYNQYSDTNGVNKIELNKIFYISKEPNDPNYTKQYQYSKIEAPKAWDINTGSKDVVVAIIDTGVDYKHSDIKDNYWTNKGEMGLDENGKEKSENGIDDDENGYIDDFRGWNFVKNTNDPMDDHGHGTHCAGSIGAKGNNELGVTGVNWEVSLVGLKFLSADGSGTTADAVEAIEYATMMGIEITSNSWGGSSAEEPDILKKAIEEAGEKGFIFVAAAGNSSSNNDTRPTYPASYDLPNIISVASSDSADKMSSFSNYGQESVDLMACGSSVYSTVSNNRYGTMSGTSMAAPIVAGTVALLKAQFPTETMSQIKDRILNNVDPIPTVKKKLVTGGRLNLYKAMK